jgi:hypothetical protein
LTVNPRVATISRPGPATSDAAPGLEQDPPGGGEQQHPVGLGPEHLGPQQPERVTDRCRPLDQPQRQKGDRQPGHVGQHVRRIREQCQ